MGTDALRSTMLGESGYQRIEGDAYFTPSWVTKALLSRIRFRRSYVWEPACGRGDMAKAIEEDGYRVHATDLHDRGYGRAGEDFLAKTAPSLDPIVTNPPYALAEAFVRHALHLTAPFKAEVAMLLRNEWDSARTRRDLFEHPAFHQKLVLTKRPRWVEDDRASPRHNFSWFIWDHARAAGPATIGWF